MYPILAGPRGCLLVCETTNGLNHGMYTTAIAKLELS
jgi:hypothetical protein